MPNVQKRYARREEESRIGRIATTDGRNDIVHKCPKSCNDTIRCQVVNRKKPGIIALSESRGTAEIRNSKMCMPGYSVIRCDAENRNTYGAILYVRDDIKYELKVINKIESNCWYVAIEISDKLY